MTGALIVSHQPRNTVGWLLMIEATLVFVWPLDTYFNNLTQAPTHLSPLDTAGALDLQLVVVVVHLPAPLYPFVFPHWQAAFSPLALAGRSWAGIVCVFHLVCHLFARIYGTRMNPGLVPNPIGFLTDCCFLHGVMGNFTTFLCCFVCGLFVCALSPCQRVEREQIKWLLYAAALFFVVYAIVFVFSDVGHG